MEPSDINKKLEKLYNERQALQGERSDLITKIDNTEDWNRINIYNNQLKECAHQMKANTEETNPLVAARNEFLSKAYFTSVGSPTSLSISSHLPEPTTPTASNLPATTITLQPVHTRRSIPWTIFMSYCWRNSKEAHDKNELDGAQANNGPCDPRQLARDLSNDGYSTWLDVDRLQLGKRLFEDLCDSILASKFAIICLSDQYLASENCRREFKYITLTLKIPYIIIVVGNTPCQWRKSFVGFIVGDTIYQETSQPIEMTKLKNSLPSPKISTTTLDPLQALVDEANGGDAASQFKLGLKFDSSFGSPTADDKQALHWYLEAAKQGHSEAQNNLAVMYDRGQGTQQSYSEAFKWYTLAADQDERQAQFNLAFLYEKARGLTGHNYGKAKAYYEKAAQAGHTGAKVRLGLMFEHGKVSEKKDLESAIRLFTEAAEKGDIQAQDILGRIYSDQKDFARAIEWSLKAASQDYLLGEHSMAMSQSQCRLGHLYYLGYGTEQNYLQAFEWYERAAKLEFADAQYMIGYLYKKGRGVDKNEVDALSWENRALDNGYQANDEKLIATKVIALHSSERLAQEKSADPLNNQSGNQGNTSSMNTGPKIVAVMGSTGSGKSTLVKQLTGCEDIIIGDALESETSEITAYTALIDGVEFQILDTPGFDDSGGEGRKFQSDVDVLQEISRYLTFAFQRKDLLTGIIYVHNIVTPRLGASSAKFINIFKELCGDRFCTNVTIATTRWDLMQSEIEMKKAVAREEQLKKSVYAKFLNQGAEYTRINTAHDGLELLKKFIHKPAQSTKLQTEIVDNHKQFDQTSAGLVLGGELAALQAKLDQEIAELKKEAKEANLAKDKATEDLIKKEQQKAEEKVRILTEKIQETHQNLAAMEAKMLQENERRSKQAEIERMVMLRQAQEKEREDRSIREQQDFIRKKALEEQRTRLEHESRIHERLLEQQLMEKEWENQRVREALLIQQRETQEARNAVERQRRAVISMTKFAQNPDYETRSRSHERRQIYTGPRGGRYYINGNGNKTYI
ncbi:hypothetical protein BDR26DRAFT_820927 [Obelidium mucronatum]|nr:hypothetical protein BDR26DRAFT_820927 [Obelidium mucronatum]